MRKMIAVLKREYLQAVRKKSFIIMTLLAPVLFGAMLFVPVLLTSRAITEKKVFVIDGTGRLESAVSVPEGDAATEEALGESTEVSPDPTNSDVATQLARSKIITSYLSAEGAADLREVAQSYIDRLNAEDEADKIDGVLLIPSDAFDDSDAEMTYFSRSATDMIAKERLSRIINREIQRTRIAERGIGRDEADALLRSLPSTSVQITKSGEEKEGGDMAFLFAFILAGLLFVPTLIYGTEVMRGIIQEKTDRVVEILISSMTPMQLLSGKIIGLALVGLTQMAIWVLMAVLMTNLGASRFSSGLGADLSFLKPSIAVYFTLFFVIGYMLYVCFYAIAGAVCNNEKEAQQFATPVMMFLMIPWFLMMPILLNPESTMSTVLSLIPFFAPITMFARIVVSEPPFWEIALAIGGAIGFIVLMFWVTAKIFRVGILSYGKRPTIPELWRWLKVA